MEGLIPSGYAMNLSPQDPDASPPDGLYNTGRLRLVVYITNLLFFFCQWKSDGGKLPRTNAGRLKAALIELPLSKKAGIDQKEISIITLSLHVSNNPSF